MPSGGVTITPVFGEMEAIFAAGNTLYLADRAVITDTL